MDPALTHYLYSVAVPCRNPVVGAIRRASTYAKPIGDRELYVSGLRISGRMVVLRYYIVVWHQCMQLTILASNGRLLDGCRTESISLGYFHGTIGSIDVSRP